jgi:hypothetical protein
MSIQKLNYKVKLKVMIQPIIAKAGAVVV